MNTHFIYRDHFSSNKAYKWICLLQISVTALVLLLVSHSVARATQKDLQQQSIGSIGIPYPSGYVEISSELFKEYTVAIAFENALRGDTFLRLYTKEQEYALVQKHDIDDLSGTMIAVLFQDMKEFDTTSISEASLKKLIDSTNNSDSTYSSMTDLEKKSVLDEFAAKVNLERIKKIRGYRQNRGQEIDNSKSAIDEDAINKWLQKKTKTTQEDLDIGFIRSGLNFVIYTWLQSNNDFIGYGIPTKNPVAVNYIIININNKDIGVIFTKKISSVDDVIVSMREAINYAESNNRNISLVNLSEHNIEGTENVITFIAEEWTRNGKTSKAIDAYKRLMHLNTTLQLPRSKIANAAVLGVCYLADQNYDAIIEQIPVFIAEAETFSGINTKVIVGLHQILAAAYTETGDIGKSILSYKKALDLAYVAHGHVNSITIDIQNNLAAQLMKGQQFQEGKKLMVDSFVAATEMSAQEKPALASALLMAYYSTLDQVNTAIFYCKISGVLIFFESLNNLNDGNTTVYSEVLKLLKLIISEQKIPISDDGLISLRKQPNESEDAIYGKGHVLMRGPEVALYKRYGEVASNLNKAGQSGTEDERQKARADFRDWMESVERVLDKK